MYLLRKGVPRSSYDIYIYTATKKCYLKKTALLYVVVYLYGTCLYSTPFLTQHVRKLLAVAHKNNGNLRNITYIVLQVRSYHILYTT